jgi:hypothetical protein
VVRQVRQDQAGQEVHPARQVRQDQVEQVDQAGQEDQEVQEEEAPAAKVEVDTTVPIMLPAATEAAAAELLQDMVHSQDMVFMAAPAAAAMITAHTDIIIVQIMVVIITVKHPRVGIPDVMLQAHQAVMVETLVILVNLVTTVMKAAAPEQQVQLGQQVQKVLQVPQDQQEEKERLVLQVLLVQQVQQEQLVLQAQQGHKVLVLVVVETLHI